MDLKVVTSSSSIVASVKAGKPIVTKSSKQVELQVEAVHTFCYFFDQPCTYLGLQALAHIHICIYLCYSIYRKLVKLNIELVTAGVIRTKNSLQKCDFISILMLNVSEFFCEMYEILTINILYVFLFPQTLAENIYTKFLFRQRNEMLGVQCSRRKMMMKG